MTPDLALLLARRALVLWALAHALALAALTAANAPPGDSVGVGMPPFVAAVFAVDLARRGERTLLANLGVGLPVVLGGAFALAAAAEAALVALLGAVA